MPTPLLSDSACAISIARDLIKYELTNYIGVDTPVSRFLHEGSDSHLSSVLPLQNQFYLFKLSFIDPP
jgi:hypothetical protein